MWLEVHIITVILVFKQAHIQSLLPGVVFTVMKTWQDFQIDNLTLRKEAGIAQHLEHFYTKPYEAQYFYLHKT